MVEVKYAHLVWFDPNHGTRENEFGMVEVKHTHRLRGCDPFVTRLIKSIICHTHAKS
jgi:hypothetical protein